MRCSKYVLVMCAVYANLLVGMCSRLAAANVTVHIKNQAFVPETVVVHVGDTVTWTNDDQEGHTATRTNAPAFSTPLLSQNQSASVVFPQVSPPTGFDYFCVPHPFMTGHVVVRPSGLHLAMKATSEKSAKVRSAQTVEVHIKKFKYNPEVVEIQVGDTVKWVNDDDDEHTATRTDTPEPFDTGLLETGGAGSHTFKTASSGMGFEYFCVPHPFMRGRIVVKLPGSHLLGDKKHKQTK